MTTHDPAVAALAKALASHLSQTDPLDVDYRVAHGAIAWLTAHGWHLVPAATPTSEREAEIRALVAKGWGVYGLPVVNDLLALLEAARDERDAALAALVKADIVAGEVGMLLSVIASGERLRPAEDTAVRENLREYRALRAGGAS